MEETDPVIIRRRRIERTCWRALYLIIANWWACGIIAVFVGGDGWSGYVQNGHYFLGSHGHYVETSYAVFLYTKIHLAITMASFPVALVCGLVAGMNSEKWKH